MGGVPTQVPFSEVDSFSEGTCRKIHQKTRGKIGQVDQEAELHSLIILGGIPGYFFGMTITLVTFHVA